MITCSCFFLAMSSFSLENLTFLMSKRCSRVVSVFWSKSMINYYMLLSRLITTIHVIAVNFNFCLLNSRIPATTYSYKIHMFGSQTVCLLLFVYVYFVIYIHYIVKELVVFWCINNMRKDKIGYFITTTI